MITLQSISTTTEPLTSTSGSLNVNITGGAASGSTVDSAAWTAATSTFFPNGGVFNDSATALTSGQQGTFRSTANRALHINLRNASGVELGLTQGNGLNVIIGDGTNVPAVKAASTAAAAADKALVVAISPNNGVKVTDAAGTNQLAINSSGEASVKNAANFSSSAALSNASVTNSSTSVLASNSARKGFLLWNETNKTVFIAFAATATTSAYTFQLNQGAYYESGPGNSYTGAISGITSAAATGSVRVTELT